jgi:TRAP-type C4-dicarboxylate transport system substrate-binding protein
LLVAGIAPDAGTRWCCAAGQAQGKPAGLDLGSLHRRERGALQAGGGKRIQGAIVIEIIDKAKAHHDDEVLAAVASGAVDIGIEGVDRIGDKVLAADFIDEPFLFNFPALRKAAVAPDSEIRQLIDVAIVAEMGVRVLWWESLGSAVVFSKGRDVTDPARMKGQRVGASSAILAEFAARC